MRSLQWDIGFVAELVISFYFNMLAFYHLFSIFGKAVTHFMLFLLNILYSLFTIEKRLLSNLKNMAPTFVVAHVLGCAG